MKTHLRSRPAMAAFTLLEVIIALTILAMFSGTLFAIIRGSVKAATEMQHVESENDQVNHFIRLCRQTFQNLPSTATVTLKVTQAGTPAMQELTVSGANEMFSFGPNPISYKDTIIGLRPVTSGNQTAEDGQPIFNVSITREDIIPTDGNQNNALIRSSGVGVLSPDDQGRVWMPLLPDTASLTWRCYKADDDTWEEEWSSTTLPELIEMNLQLSGRSHPIRVVYTLPTIKLTSANAALKPQTPKISPVLPSAAGDNTGGGGIPQRG
ncbi:MAG: prepilin-type N-terminal cleavage/methylation domain-containing protein, partial [Verrucomicrobiaceae bacterium]